MSHIVVAGSLNMDLVVRAPRFPAPGETLIGAEFRTVPGGKGANQALAAARQGGQVHLVGRVGADAFGERLRAGLRAGGVATEYIREDADAPTGIAAITIDAQGENTIIVVPGANGRLTPADVDAAAPILAGAGALLLQLEVPLPTVAHAAGRAHAAGIPVILNAAPAQPLPAALLAQVAYLIINETEAALLSGEDAAHPAQAAESLRAAGAQAVIVTLGAAGALLADEAGVTHCPGFRVPVVDTTAAGDAFAGAFAVALASGRPAREAVRRGNAAGALAVTALGAQPALPTRAAVDALLGE